MADLDLRSAGDEILTERAMNDPEAAAEMLRRIMPSIRSIAMSISPEISDDLMQEGLLGALSAIKSFDKLRGTPRAYLLACAKNKMLSSIKRNSPIPQSDEDASLIADNNDTEEKIRRELFENAMERCLSPLERSVLSLYVTGMSYRSIASKLGISEKSVDNAVSRARKKLKDQFGGV